MTRSIEEIRREIETGVQCYWSKEQLLKILDQIKPNTQQTTQTKLF